MTTDALDAYVGDACPKCGHDAITLEMASVESCGHPWHRARAELDVLLGTRAEMDALLERVRKLDARVGEMADDANAVLNERLELMLREEGPEG